MVEGGRSRDIQDENQYFAKPIEGKGGKEVRGTEITLILEV
jgi:hypothetical protein